ncbi:MAG: divalent-cation tolerance protein CutA [Alphaproteobacteria bacterium]|nr:divalent-cation tolerance protein CutA [Alphaproteobacteria bacterium]
MNAATLFVYVTCANQDEAKRIGRVLVEARLVACANVMAPHTAIYRWQGKLAEEAETALVLKTRAELLVHVSERIRQMHSYKLPCIVALPIVGGHAPYLQWIEGETGEG